MDDTEKMYTLANAAAATGRSMPTIRRKREELEAAGAVVTPKRWEIPHSALIAAGFKPDWTTADAGGDEGPQEPLVAVAELEAAPTLTEELQTAKDRIRRLESENQILRHHVDRWQAVGRERLDALNDQRLAFRALAMTRPQQQLEAAPTTAPEKPAEEPRRGWWSRTFG